jgi:murein DD-endopeptidase MepM/ murein hydrolase activator NlpD
MILFATTFTPRKNTLAMNKNAIHNFNISIKNSAAIKSSEDLTEAIIKELAKVSKEMSQQKDIVQVWQEQNALNTTIRNNSSVLPEVGAIDTSIETIKKTALSASSISSVFEGTIANHNVLTGTISSETIGTSNALIGGGVVDTNGRSIVNSTVSGNTTPPIAGADNNTLNFSSGLTTQTYASVATQQTLTVPQMLQENSSEPTIEVVKAAVKKRLDLAITANDSVEIEYWRGISNALDEGATVQDFYGKPNDILFTQMYAVLKQSNSLTLESQSFNWEIVRKKMIDSIDANILKGYISPKNEERWKTIKKLLYDDKTNVANLFEQYDELFLLLKEVEGLDVLPNTITINTNAKIYPNLSADKLYAAIGKEDVYVFLKKINNDDIQGSAVDKGAVKIKNTEATTFIVGESLEFNLDEKFIRQNLFKKEHINWVIYNIQNKKDKGIVFVNEGTSFNYNFDTAGIYRVDAYGQSATVKGKKSAKGSTFIELQIVAQEIIITPPTSIVGGIIRASDQEQLFKVALRNSKVKTLNPLKLYYQLETTTANKVTKISEKQELDSTGIIRLTMPDLGEYKVKVSSKDQYALVQESSVSVIKNEVVSIGQAKEVSKKAIFLLGNPDDTLTLEAKTFKINPATDEEKENVKWLIYDSNNKPYLPPGAVLLTENKDPKKAYLHKWSSFTMAIPQTEGRYKVEAYSESKKGAKANSVFEIEVLHPQVTEAQWTYASGDLKKVSGLSGEENHVKASIPGYINQKVIIYFLVDGKRNTTRYITKTNDAGIVNTSIKFDDTFRKQLGLTNKKNGTLQFIVEGEINGKSYAFKKARNKLNDTILINAEKKIIDTYFVYDDNRVTPFTQVPYGAKITGVVKTLNMVGKEIVLKVYKRNAEYAQLREKTIVNNEGVATISFVLNKKWHVINPFIGIMDMFYLGMDGFESKLSLENGLNAVSTIGAKKKNMTNLTWGSKVTKEFREKVIEICSELWPENTIEMANGLMAVMYRETNSTFAANQMAGYKSLIPREQMTKEHFEKINKETGKMSSRAVGLIQFTQDALVSMKEFENGKGFDKLHKLKLEYAKMTDVKQLEKVKKYFNNVARLPKVPEDIYVAVFSPDFVGKESNYTLYKKGTENYKANPGLDKNDNGIQKSELLVKYHESFKEGNKSDNIASVSFEKKVDVCPKGKCIHYADVVKNPKINNQSNDIDKNRWHRKMRFNNNHREGYYHTGVDILAQPNTSLKSLLCGTVTISGDTHGDLGIIVVVKSKDKEGKGVWIEYCHLSSTSVTVGQVIKHGEEIGLSGYTGNAKSIKPIYYHVHIEASTDGVFYGGKNRVDPELYMKTKF